MDIADPVQATADLRVGVDPDDLGQQPLIAHLPRRGRSILVGVVAVRGDLDPVLGRHSTDQRREGQARAPTQARIPLAKSVDAAKLRRSCLRRCID